MTERTSSLQLLPNQQEDSQQQQQDQQPQNHLEEEYVDYSCSTSMERLARDVETILRNWHVDQGSDRHVSHRHHINTAATTTTRTASAPLLRRAGPPAGANAGVVDNYSYYHHDDGILNPIRSAPVAWTVSSYAETGTIQEEEEEDNGRSGDGRPSARSRSRSSSSTDRRVVVSEQIDLELVLWDGPSSGHFQPQPNDKNNHDEGIGGHTKTTTTTTTTTAASSTDMAATAPAPVSVLPYSLQVGRRQMATSPRPEQQQQQHDNQNNYYRDGCSTDLFHDFATMFGIGQHITLSPINPNYIPAGWVQQQPPPPPQPQLSRNSHKAGSAGGRSSFLLLRHDSDRVAPELLRRLLTTQLQTAMNIAASSCQCCFPVFGVWGPYQPQLRLQQHRISSSSQYSDNGGSNHATAQGHQRIQQTINGILPAWMAQPPLSVLEESVHPSAGGRRRPQSASRRRGGRRGEKRYWNANALPPLLSGRVTSPDCIGRFECSAVPVQCVWAIANDQHSNPNNKSGTNDMSSPAMWPLWRYVLQRHMWATSSSQDTAVYLWCARHVYAWFKDDDSLSLQDQLLAALRPNTPIMEWRRPSRGADNSAVLNIVRHRGVVRSPNNDAYRRECRQVALHLLEQAAGATDRNPLWGPVGDPVISLQATLTWNGKSLSDQSSTPGPAPLVEPLVCLPVQSRSKLSQDDWLDMVENMESTILDPERATVFKVSVFFDHEMAQVSLAATQHCILAALIRTVTLPRAMLLSRLTDEQMMLECDSTAGDHLADALSERAHVSETTRSLVAVMDWAGAAESMIQLRQAEDIVREVFNGRTSLMFPLPPEDFAIAGRRVWKPLMRSARPARLLSLLFVRMAGVRTPPSMALVWDCFVRELRRRWEFRESLPNMTAIAALDPSPVLTQCQANLAAYVNSTEPAPDDSYCLIGQKLQVFNLCLELVVASEARDPLQLEKRPRLDGSDNSTSQPMTTAVKRTRTLLNGSIVNGLPKVDYSHHEHVDDDGQENKIEFFDAEEGTDSNAYHICDGESTFQPDPVRMGARCPVQGLYLTETGDQLYAPYLQRPYPLTDDMVAERRGMIARQAGRKASATVRQRLEITQRLRKPKLLSDMRAFKAANPGCVFEDFIHWYGNPDNLLEGYDDGMDQSGLLDMTLTDDVATQLDRAAESIRILDATREFWSSTWEMADPVPAIEQENLFDAASVAEMSLDYLETLHPASLLCQVMSVNLSMAYFALVASAEDLVRLDKIKGTLLQVREKVESALQLLATDASGGVGVASHWNATLADGEDYASLATGCRVVSIESISACERACVALGQAEVLVSRATSLIGKFPNGYDLVQRIMTTMEGSEIEIMGKSTRNMILASIEGERSRGTKSSPTNQLRPSVREYLLRNSDGDNPCQLCVRYGGRGSDGIPDGCSENELLLALTTTELL